LSDWRQAAACDSLDTELFFEGYEANEATARSVDDICLGCPVIKQCLEYGLENHEIGVWGGTYLAAGKVQKSRNTHKTVDICKEWSYRTDHSVV